MIGFHMQEPVQNWPSAAALLPAGTWVKAVSDQGLCRDFKAHNPGLKVVFRYEFNRHQHLEGDYHQLARDFFGRFIDGTFWQQEMWRYIDAIEEWNEYLANSQDAAERGRWLAWCKAVNEVWTNEYRYHYGELNHIRLVSCNTAIGNDIPVEFARVVQQHDGILAYHNYTNVHKGEVTGSDWPFYSGRWATMDAAYRAAGVTVRWLFTEGGACTMGVVDGVNYTGVQEGWKHPANYDGNLDAYINGAIKYQIDNVSAWNKAHGNRALGGVLFTSGNQTTGDWRLFNLTTEQWLPIAQFVRDYAPEPVDPPPPPPPPSTDPTAQLLAFGRSITDANNDSALQQAIWRDGWDIGGPEKWTTIDGVQYAVKPAVKQGKSTIRAYYCRVPEWNKIKVVEG